ncbi:MAG: ABC transporter ATP-binding protein [Candidatus Limimorpha sp.]
MIILDKICKSYGGNVIFSDFGIGFRDNVISCILGPSGCGKTTLLNIIGAVDNADGGAVEGVDGRRISYVFQEPRLLPWLTARENIELVLKGSREEIRRETDEILRLVELEGCSELYPSQLSGGMSQRVSIARAFAYPSEIMLMDEPFSGLDLSLKENIMERFLFLWRKKNRTVIFVTHDIDEAITLSDDIFIFSKSPVSVLLHKNDIKSLNHKTLNDEIIEVFKDF